VKKTPSRKSLRPIEALIHDIRGRRVLLDVDLAAIYGVTTAALNQAVKRNDARFPADFAFQLGSEEIKTLISQNVISKPTRGGRTKPPRAFTEHGALQAANVLKSKRAVAMSLFVIRAFVKMREQLLSDAAILRRLAEIDKTLLVHDSALHNLYQKLLPLLSPPSPPPKRQIGFGKS
jgi:hypothetical protein